MSLISATELKALLTPDPKNPGKPYVEPGWLPNLRRLCIPDPGMMFIDMDLSRADAYFVAWEANDETLKVILREGRDLHWENAVTIWGQQLITKYPDLDDREDSSICPERYLAKRMVHAINYGAFPRKLAKALGISEKLAEWIYAVWFKHHPGVRAWHNKVQHQLNTTRRVSNPFGFERYYFDRPAKCLNEGLAWVPQSSVGVIINTAWVNIDANLPDVEILMQNHDSLLMQIPDGSLLELLPRIQEESLIPVPYEDPMLIPVGFKCSTSSWGEVKDPTKFYPALKPILAKGLEDARNKTFQGLA
jgi:DNA polymerase-1